MNVNESNVVEKAATTLAAESRKREIASQILNVLSTNNVTVSEATSILALVDKSIVQARLSSLQLAHEESA